MIDVRREVYRPLTAAEAERADRPGPACLTCGHEAVLHEDDMQAACIMDCPCDTLHLDTGDCTDECYEVNYRSCDECGKVEFHDDSGPFDWVNGVCEICDPSILDLPENVWRG